MRKVFGMILVWFYSSIFGQEQADSLKQNQKYLPEITVVGWGSKSDVHQLPEIVGTSIYAGKKNALILMDNVKGNILTNTMRQVVAKVPGIHIWESDGSGIQIGISTRGLSPNRSWEFNVRQNGYDIAADPFGYPEAYYNPQLQAVQRIEIIRGHGSLQYGPQFGGMVNYILRNGNEINKPFEVETQQSVGSFGLFNTYNAIGGETKNFHYYTFFDHRSASGWRENSRYFTNSGFGTFTWKLNSKFSVTTELMRSHIRSQQPGGITDQMLATQATKSLRARNWMDIDWTTLAIIANYQISNTSKFNFKAYHVKGDRGSIGFIRLVTVMDTLVSATGQYNNRSVDLDQYRNTGMEARYLGDFHIGKTAHTFSGGIRFFKGNTFRYRDGLGTTASDFNLTRLNDFWGKDIDYNTSNFALFAENIFRITDRLIIIPGIRYEWVEAKVSGINGYSNDVPIYLRNMQKIRSFLLGGIGTEYHLGNTEFYANITQAYRPLQFADLTAPPTTNEIDPNLKDAKGYNADLGYRGKVKNFLQFDLSVYLLQYNNKVGTLLQQRADGNFYNLTTNVGNSTSKGFETFVEWNILKMLFASKSWGDLNIFTSYAYNDARFADFKVVQRIGNDLVETNLKDKKVENAPLHILRSGITYSIKGVSFSAQYSYVDKSYADANNTEKPSVNAQNGIIPAYRIVDLSMSLSFKKHYNLKAGVNNLTNARYFTRRAGGYPGPGVLPADGRNFFISIGAKF